MKRFPACIPAIVALLFVTPACSFFTRPAAGPQIQLAASLTVIAPEPVRMNTATAIPPVEPLPTEIPATLVPSQTPVLEPLSAEPYRMVDVSPEEGRLLAQLRGEVQTAADLGLRPFAFFTAEWCINCQELIDSLDDPSMERAFQGTYIVRLDLDVWKDQAAEAGIYVLGIPAFFELGADGKATGRSITGGAWDENIPANMSSPLEAFFQGEE